MNNKIQLFLMPYLLTPGSALFRGCGNSFLNTRSVLNFH